MSNIDKRYVLFTKDLETYHIQGIEDVCVKWIGEPLYGMQKQGGLDVGYVFYTILHESEFPYMDVIEQGLDTKEPLRLLSEGVTRVFWLIEQGRYIHAIKRINNTIDIAEAKIDRGMISDEEILESVLNDISFLKHLKRFIESPNPRTAGAAFPKEKQSNYHKVVIYHGISHVFLRKGMKKEAKDVIENVIDIQGDFRLLKTMKDTYEKLNK